MNELLSFAIMTANAASEGEGTSVVGFLLTTILPCVAFFAIMYFIMVRPQKKKQKEEELNNLKKPYTIKIGQKLKITDNQTNNLITTQNKSINVENKIKNSNVKIAKNEEKKEIIEKKPLSDFVWPVKGNIISSFGNKASGLYNDGINISAKIGTDFVSTRDGVVAYVGNELNNKLEKLLNEEEEE